MTGALSPTRALGESPPAPGAEGDGPLGPSRRRRFEGLDVARGIALLAMAAYHGVWDLGFLQVTADNLAITPAGRVAARLIAGSFLFMVGLSLVLAHERGVRWRAFLGRLGLVSAAAAAITVATYYAFPDSFIFFGILHHIAVASVLALPFLRAPWPVVLGAAGLALAAPALFAGPAFDASALAFLGLGTSTPATNDFVPVLPWFGFVLAGVGTAKLMLPRIRGGGTWASWHASSRSTRALAWAGRHGLAVYLVHQPLLLALLYPVALAVGPHPRAGIASFQSSFEQNCTRQGEDARVCREAASCVVDKLSDAGLWAAAAQNRLSPEERARAQDLARGCFDAARGERP